MKRDWVKLTFLILFTLTFLLLQPVLKDWSATRGQTVQLAFTLPIPQEVMKKNFLTSEDLKIEKVYVSGFFCKWNPTNENYRLKQKGERWTTRVFFKPGQNQYKFVLFLEGYSDPVWVEGHSAKKVPDGYGGYNSVCVVPDLAFWALLIRLFFLGLIIILAVSLIAKPVMSFIASLRVSLRFKVPLFVLLLLSLIGGTMLFFEQRERNAWIKRALIEEVALIHSDFLKEGVDFDDLHSTNFQKKIQKVLGRSFYFSDNSFELESKLHPHLTLSDLVLFDTNWQLISYSKPFGKFGMDESRLTQTGFSDLRFLYRRGYFAKIINKARKKKSGFKFLFGKIPKKLFYFYSPGKKNYESYFPGNLFLLPIFNHGKKIGYYGGIFVPDSWGSLFRDYFFIQLFLLILGLFVTFIFLSRFTGIFLRWMEGVRTQLTHIAQDQFKVQDDVFEVQLRNEPEMLKKDLEQTRLSLKKEVESLQNLYQFKFRFYNSLTHELSTPINSILSRVQSLRYGAFTKSADLIHTLKRLSERDYTSISRGEQIQKHLSVLMSLSEEEYQLKKLGFLQLAQLLKATDPKGLKLTQQILRDIDLEEGEMLDAYRIIRDSGRHLLEIVGMLSELEEIRDVHFKIKKTKLKIRPFVDRLIQEVSITEEYQEKEQVQLLVEFEEGIEVEISLHELWTRKVLMSLLMNALQHSEKGVILLSVERDGGFILFSVTDEGIGISEEKQSRIFLEMKEKKNQRKSGVSLVLAKQLVGMQKGKIGFKSEENKGSKFWFSLPVEEWKTNNE